MVDFHYQEMFELGPDETEYRNLGAEYVSTVEIDGRRALNEVSCTVEASGITVVLGPSGSGKTTLLRLCNRLTVPTSGKISYRGESLDAVDPLALRRAVGMVFQRPTPFAGSVRDNLQVAVADAGDNAMSALLTSVGLDRSFLDRDAQSLSGGEAQRVCLARTMLTEPEAVLLDEPTSALDVDARLAFERLMRGIADAGTPVVWVTHDLEQARRVGDRSIVLVEGRLGSEEEARHFIDHEAELAAEGADDGSN